MLCDCFFELNETGSMKSWDFVANKYLSLAEKLDAPVDMRALLKNVREQILASPYRDFVVSRGEYLSAKLLSAALGFRYIEAAEVVRFFPDGALNLAESERLLADSAKTAQKAALWGLLRQRRHENGYFSARRKRHFGSGGGCRAERGNIRKLDGRGRLFRRRPLYGFSPRLVPCLSYEQLRILSSLGARVLHSDSVLPVCAKNIPINIRNFYKPHLDGSMIVPVSASGRRICGIVSETVYKYSFREAFTFLPKRPCFFKASPPKAESASQNKDCPRAAPPAASKRSKNVLWERSFINAPTWRKKPPARCLKKHRLRNFKLRQDSAAFADGQLRQSGSRPRAQRFGVMKHRLRKNNSKLKSGLKNARSFS